MGNMTLSKYQKEQYKEIVQKFKNNETITLNDKDFVRLRETLCILEFLGYIKSLNIDNANILKKSETLKILKNGIRIKKWKKESFL